LSRTINGEADNKGIKDHKIISAKVSKSHRLKKGRATLPVLSASEEAMEISSDSQLTLPPKCQMCPVPELMISVNKHKCDTPDSSGSEDDRPILKTYKATQKVLPKSLKMVTFAPQNSSEEEYDDPFANEDPSEVGDASHSPPHL
jgi:hypothetical protein